MCAFSKSCTNLTFPVLIYLTFNYGIIGTVSKSERFDNVAAFLCHALVHAEKYFCVFFKGIIKKSWEKLSSSFSLTLRIFCV